MRDFIRLGEDEIEVFQRLMECGSSAAALSALPLQLSELVQRKINAERLPEIKGIESAFIVRHEAGDWFVSVEWSVPAATVLPRSSRLRALLMLRSLLEFVRGVNWGGPGVLPSGAPAVAEVVARARLKDEVARLFWLAFVVERVGKDAVRRKQQRAATGDGEAQREFAKKLRAQGVDRALAVKRLAASFAVSIERARRVLKDVGWHGR